MRRLPKLRKVCKWTGLVLSVLLLVVWVGSAWFYLGKLTERGWWRLSEGRIEMYHGSMHEGPTGLNLGFRAFSGHSLHWTFLCNMSFDGVVPQGALYVPLWMPTLVISTLTALTWNRDRRLSKPGLCKQCGYDIRGVAVCPECGVSVNI